MADMGLRGKMLVKDVMSSPVVTSRENTPIDKVAQLMAKNDIGCIVITDKQAKPSGIITEKDLVERVLAKNAKPDSVQATEVMTSPLLTIEPDATISDAARKMSRLNIRRLGVVYKGQLYGVISSKDILGVMPELIEIIQEQARIQTEKVAQEDTEENEAAKEEEAETSPLAGYCDLCRAWSDNLTEVNGEFLCEDCKAESVSEE